MHWALQVLSSFAAAACFSVLLYQPRGTVIVSSLIAAAGYGLFLLLGQTTAGYFFATLLIAVCCEVCARIMKRVATLFITSSLIPLVPGVGLYRTIRYILEAHYDQALSEGTSTLMGICAIALGITFSSLFFANLRKKQQKKSSC